MTKRNVTNEQFMTAQAMAADFYSEPIKMTLAKGFNIRLEFTGSPVGTLKLQASLDTTNKHSLVPTGSGWSDIPDSSQAVAAAGDHLWIDTRKYKWVRVAYTATSGSGSCSGVYYSVEEY